MTAVGQYFNTLFDQFGEAWNRFWFEPREPYTLSLMRVLTGMIALYTQLTLLPDAVRFFAASGWLPTEAITEIEAGRSIPSYFSYLTSATEVRMAIVLGIVVLAMFTIGLFTRLATVGSLLVMASTVNRGPMLASQLEPAIIMVLFYLCFAPTGEYFSVDGWLKRRRASQPGATALSLEPQRSVGAAIATRLLQVHLSMLYATMGLSKLFSPEWWNGSGVWWLAMRPNSSLVDLSGLGDHPYLINAWTHAIVAFELAFAILIWNRLARPLLLGISVVMWLLTGLLIGNLPFALTMLVANLAFVRPEALLRAFGALRGRSREHRRTAEQLEAKIV